MKVLYLVHDLNDSAVARRVSMLLDGGASVDLAGFYRGEAPPAEVRGVPAHALDRSYDARLAARAGAVARQVMGAGALARRFAEPDVIIARNLEMLALATALVGRFKSRPAVVYECLDVHRLMVSAGTNGKIMRRIESQLLSFVSLLIVSSPAFLERYFEPVQGYRGPALLIENKAAAGKTGARTVRPAGPPWRIGWFGMLRCSRSLRLLADLAQASNGKIEVLIAGKPARTELVDFEAMVAASPGLSYAGPYTAEQLAELYGQVHFAWAIDYFEEGLNSAWLLPNRLYEGAAHGAVPIALSDVQTGRWLAGHRAGALITDPAAELSAFFEGLTDKAYRAHRSRVGSIPLTDLTFDRRDCSALVASLAKASGRG